MQLLLILSIIFAMVAVIFAVQNNMPITVSLGMWSFDSTLALVLISALGAGALIASLLSTPTVISGQANARRLRRQIIDLEERNRSLERRVRELDQLPPPADERPVEEREAVRDPRQGLRSTLLNQHSLR